MIFLNTLRMIVDLSFYFFFAELFVISTGNPSQMTHMLLLSVCYAVMVYLHKKEYKKFYYILPALVLLVPNSCVWALLPAIGYILYIVAKDTIALSWDRQSELFSISYKVFLDASVCISLAGNYVNVIRYSLPMAFISIVTSILLMRMLRHEPETYLSPQYQLKNCFLLLVVLFVAWLSSRDFVFSFIGNSISFVYMNCIYPILLIMINCLVLFIKLVMNLFSWIKLGEVKFEENLLPESEGSPTALDFSTIVSSTNDAFKSVLYIILFILLLVLAFFFFRWLALNRGEESILGHGLDIIRGSDSASTKKERSTSTVLQVRRQYRIFLKLYQAHGGRLEQSDTSQDILKRSSTLFPQNELMEEMREIYLMARYRNTASKSDLKRMRQINKEMASISH